MLLLNTQKIIIFFLIRIFWVRGVGVLPVAEIFVGHCVRKRVKFGADFSQLCKKDPEMEIESDLVKNPQVFSSPR